jgi:hypothetical protein
MTTWQCERCGAYVRHAEHECETRVAARALELERLLAEQSWEDVARSWADRLVDGQAAWDTPTRCLRAALTYIDQIRAAAAAGPGTGAGSGRPLPGSAPANWTAEDQAFFERIHRRREQAPASEAAPAPTDGETKGSA